MRSGGANVKKWDGSRRGGRRRKEAVKHTSLLGFVTEINKLTKKLLRRRFRRKHFRFLFRLELFSDIFESPNESLPRRGKYAKNKLKIKMASS